MNLKPNLANSKNYGVLIAPMVIVWYIITELGSGTGKLKLRQVYDQFVERFPTLALVISFQTFAEMVADALVEMREMLAKNENIAALVNG